LVDIIEFFTEILNTKVKWKRLVCKIFT